MVKRSLIGIVDDLGDFLEHSNGTRLSVTLGLVNVATPFTVVLITPISGSPVSEY